ncbi:T53 [Tupaiid betaherpesvirus 1]|uniref:T53 n=1 Tax=Tupaiid herpesvirus 1 (strain 1) TaxID=10397 RepID=Q91TN5_TUHV1|nr:T53 [Tupaiid betaherpesvirus 1]AAK57102.1 T53 [Tupaiid betaherpesvirus 1]
MSDGERSLRRRSAGGGFAAKLARSLKRRRLASGGGHARCSPRCAAFSPRCSSLSSLSSLSSAAARSVVKACDSTSAPPSQAHLKLSLPEMHAIFEEYPDLEQKYLSLMKMPITGKEAISLPFHFHSHRHACLDLSPYSNEQISKSACRRCLPDRCSSATASDAMVAFINQSSNIMKNRTFYYGFRKDLDLLRLSINQPQLFQFYYIVHAALPDVVPLIYPRQGIVHMHLVFEEPEVHIPCDCINQLLMVAKDTYALVLDIVQGRIVLSITCQRLVPSTVKIDLSILQRKVDEMDIPNDVNERFERYKTMFWES